MYENTIELLLVFLHCEEEKKRFFKRILVVLPTRPSHFLNILIFFFLSQVSDVLILYVPIYGNLTPFVELHHHKSQGGITALAAWYGKNITNKPRKLSTSSLLIFQKRQIAVVTQCKCGLGFWLHENIF